MATEGLTDALKMVHVWDPGQTTGYARFLMSLKDGYTLLETRIFDDDPNTLVKWWANDYTKQLDAHPFAGLFIVEEFRLRENKMQNLQHNNMIASIVRGRIDFMAALSGIPIVYQQPSAMVFSNMALRERLGLSKLPKTEHERDALKHGLYFFFNQKSKAQKEPSRKGSDRPPLAG